MSSFMNNIANFGRKINGLDPLDRGTQNFVLGHPPAGRNYYGEAPNAPPTAPTTDTAANLQNQQDQLRNLQRGVLSNIFAGSNSPAPTTGSRQLLGS